jgi:hypothetical protein
MATARVKMLWDHTAMLVWITAEVNRDRKKRSRPYKPSDFYPFRRKVRRRPWPSVEQLTREILMTQEHRQGGR